MIQKPLVFKGSRPVNGYAGDIHFHRSDGSLYLTAYWYNANQDKEGKLLWMDQPWLPPPRPIVIRPGVIPADLEGVGLAPPYTTYGFRENPNIEGKYDVYSIHLGYGTVGDTPRQIGAHEDLDNIRGVTTLYTLAKPDLVGKSFDVTTDPATAGADVNVTFEVGNDGARNSGPFDVTFYLSKDALIDAGDVPLNLYDPYQIDDVAPGKADTPAPAPHSVTLALPGASDTFWGGAGTYYIGMVVDSSGNVAETDENNNVNVGTGIDGDSVGIVVPTVSIGNAAALLEGDSGQTYAVFTVTLSDVVSLEVNVDYATADGTALVGSDFESTSGTLTFPPNDPGQLVQTISVPVYGDALDEDDPEDFFVNLSGAVNARIEGGRGQGRATISDDDPQPSVSIDSATINPELHVGTQVATFTVTLSEPSGKQIAVHYATVDKTATAGEDYTPTSGTLTFAPGETVKQIPVDVRGDRIDEFSEEFLVRLSEPVNVDIVSPAEGTGTIIDDDPPAELSIGDVEIDPEGDDGTTANAVFTVTLTPASGKPVSVDCTTADVTATAGEDYQAVTTRLTFPAGVTQQTFSVAVIGDALPEPDESFVVRLSNPAGAVIDDPDGQGTIIDDDMPTVSIGDATIDPEGNGGLTAAEFTVTLSAPVPSTVTVDFGTFGGTAAEGQDYMVTGGQVEFPPNVTQAKISVFVVGDTLDDLDEEEFYVRLANPVNAKLGDEEGDDEGVGTIVDDDDPPVASIDDQEITEGAGSEMVFTVSLSAPSGRTVTVDYATADETAKAGEDYALSGGTLTFEPGDPLTQTLSIQVHDDTTDEFDETFLVNLTGNASVTLSGGPGEGTIHPDLDPPPTISIADVTVDPEGTGDGTPLPGNTAEFIVSLSEPSGKTITVNYTTVDNTAVAAADYQAVTAALEFAPGVTELTITVPVAGDEEEEPRESFFLDLSGPVNATLLDGRGEATIVDDDAPVLSISNETVDPEGDTGITHAPFSISLSRPSAHTVTVDYTTQDGTAIAGSDYGAISGTLTIPPGTTEILLPETVPVYGDTLPEADETFFLVLSNANWAVIESGQDRGQGNIIDDDPVTIFIDDATIDPEGGQGERNPIEFTVRLSEASEATVTVDYTTTDDTATSSGATAGQDYQQTSGSLTFPPGTTEQAIVVDAIGDELNESDESFFVDLSNAVHAEIDDGRARGTIVDDDDDALRVTYVELTGQDPSEWIALKTTRRGFLTAELTSGEGQLVTLVSRTEPPLATGKRIDWPAGAAGETYYLKVTGTANPVDLRLANLVTVSPDGTQVDVYGTGGDDAFEASFAASPYSVLIKGITYDATMFPSMTGLSFFGQGGSDTALVIGSDGDDEIVLYPHSGSVTGPDYELQLSDFSSMTVRGRGGYNKVSLADSPGNDNYVGANFYAAMYGQGYYNRAHDVSESRAGATGGIDVAKFYDSPGDDLYVSTPIYNAVIAENFKNVARYFEGVHVYATAGGVDRAAFYDSPGDDTYVGTPTYAALYNDDFGGQRNASFYNRAKFFEQSHASATDGGVDLAKFYDSPADDEYVAGPTYAEMVNSSYQYLYTNGFSNRAEYFEAAHAYGTAGGYDAATFYDSPEDDIFYADPIQGLLFNVTYEEEHTRGFFNRAKFFESVVGFSTAGGTDVARMHGSNLNDELLADSGEVSLVNAVYEEGYTHGFYNRAMLFEQVDADGHEGEGDRATLMGLQEIGLEEDWTRYDDPQRTYSVRLRRFEIVDRLMQTGDGS